MGKWVFDGRSRFPPPLFSLSTTVIPAKAGIQRVAVNALGARASRPQRRAQARRLVTDGDRDDVAELGAFLYAPFAGRRRWRSGR